MKESYHLCERKPGKPALAFFSFQTAKEGLKRFIRSPQDTLQDQAVNPFKFGTRLFDARQLVGLFDLTKRLSFKAVGVSALLQAGVVKLTTKRQSIIQACCLRFAWIDAVLEGFSYYSVSHAAHAPTVKGAGEAQDVISAACRAVRMLTWLEQDNGQKGVFGREAADSFSPEKYGDSPEI